MTRRKIISRIASFLIVTIIGGGLLSWILTNWPTLYWKVTALLAIGFAATWVLMLLSELVFETHYTHYYVKIGMMLPLLRNLRRRKILRRQWVDSLFTFLDIDEAMDSRVLDSFGKRFVVEKLSKVEKMLVTNRPTFVKREHLMAKRFFRPWAFAIVLLFNEIRFVRRRGPNYCLKVDLRNQSYGIYNTLGKRFLSETFLRSGGMEAGVLRGDGILEFLSNRDGTEKEMRLNCDEIPLRWASGTVLPIANWRGESWFVLFFRDIAPIGWNLPSGASENKEEYKNPLQLIMREFAEEVVLLDRDPFAPGQLAQSAVQKLFHSPHLNTDIFTDLKSEEFSRQHRELRFEHDGLKITTCGGPVIRDVKTPFSLELTYHDANRETKVEEVADILFIVNPTEFGLEIAKILRFDMDPDDSIIDGEIWERDSSLVRQPVMLLKCEYIKKIFGDGGRVPGMIDDRKTHLNCLRVDSIPSDAYRLFAADVKFGAARASNLDGEPGPRVAELERLCAWREAYENVFDDICSAPTDLNNSDHADLTTFCPVTWKCFLLASRFGLLP